MANPQAAPIIAAGAVLWRRSARPWRVEVAVIHRPRYDDWSHPKGKLKPGEPEAAAALREVKEETGMDCVLGAPLPDSHYLTGGRPKLVRYWAAEAVGGCFTVNDEVDRMVWLQPAEARRLLSQERDRPLIDAALRTIGSVR